MNQRRFRSPGVFMFSDLSLQCSIAKSASPIFCSVSAQERHEPDSDVVQADQKRICHFVSVVFRKHYYITIFVLTHNLMAELQCPLILLLLPFIL